MSSDTIALLVFGATYIGAAAVFWKGMDAAYKRGKKDGTIIVEVLGVVEEKKKIDEAYRAGYRTGVEEVTEVVDAEKRESEVKDKLGVGDVVAYRTCDDNDSEWRCFTVRLVEGGYLYEREDKTGDNIAIECAHKVMVHN